MKINLSKFCLVFLRYIYCRLFDLKYVLLVNYIVKYGTSTTLLTSGYLLVNFSPSNWTGTPTAHISSKYYPVSAIQDNSEDEHLQCFTTYNRCLKNLYWIMFYTCTSLHKECANGTNLFTSFSVSVVHSSSQICLNIMRRTFVACRTYFHSRLR